MSYVDTFMHEFVGNLNGLPIYHPLETNKDGAWGDADFSCTPENLIIGGGSGEHPALVIHGLESLVANYVILCIDKHTELNRGYPVPPESTLNRLYDLALFKESDNLEFCGWRMSHVSEFVENAKSKIHATPLDNPDEAEEWIKLSIGEFVFYSMPDLNPYQDEILNLAGIKDGWELGYWMNNVTCPPPNYVKSKKQSLQASGFTTPGFFRWDYQYPPQE